MKILKKVWFNIINRIRFPIEDGILFIHKAPKVFNIGDYLCSPRHYIKFEKPINGLVIVGGGAFPNFALNFIEKNYLDKNKTILWAIGTSQKHFLHKSEKIEKLPVLEWGIRDIDKVSIKHFLPCVSCLHSMLDEPIEGTETLLFLNINPKVSSSKSIEEYKNLAKEKNWYVLFNNCDEDAIKKALKTSKHIITNSYHGAYWGLLSDHKITLLGYSSKFISLLKIFGFDDSHLIHFEQGDGDSLLNELRLIEDDAKSIQLYDYKNTLNNFRRLNLHFINILMDKGIIMGYECKFQNKEDYC